MRQNALERPRKCSDIVPRTFLAHFCHFWSSKFWAILKIFAKMRFCGLRTANICCAKMAIWHTSETASKSLSDVCPIAIFAQHMFSDERPQNRIFGPLRGYTGKIKNFEKCNFSAWFWSKIFRKIFENFWKKNAIFSTDSRRSKISKMVSRKRKQDFERSLSTNRDNRARSIPYDQLLDLKMPHSKNHFLTLQKNVGM